MSVVGAVVSLVVTFGAAAIGGRFLPDQWYRALRKPEWNPPNWLFGPVWTVLYLMMAAAAWLIWRKYGIASAIVPLGFFVLQLALNAMWSWLFFGRHEIRAALIDLGLLWLAILVTIVLFWGRETLAGVLLVPYLGWVSFAGVLNATILRLNPS
ncbi:MAG TPA: TspO/MBR family protein [Anaerolineales bacterium]